jgi:transcription-repair coupling factor (superfamily II helicase)
MLLDKITRTSAFQELCKELSGKRKVGNLAVLRSARPALIAGLSTCLNYPIVYIQDRVNHALATLDEMGFWSGHIPLHFFSEPIPLFYEHAVWDENIRKERLLTLGKLVSYQIPGAYLSHQAPVIITTIRALMYRTLNRREFIKNTRNIKKGQNATIDELIHTWSDIGYEGEDIVTRHGQYSRRGGIVDIWPSVEDSPVRLEFFGNQIETLRLFDPTTQRTIKEIDTVMITPAREILPYKVAEARDSMIRAEEFYIPLVYKTPASLLDYLPSESLVVVDDLNICASQAEELEEKAEKLRKESVKDGTLSNDFPVPYLSWSELMDQLEMHSWLEMGYSSTDTSSPVASIFTPGNRFGGKLKVFIEELSKSVKSGEQNIIVSRQVSRLKELWNEFLKKGQEETPVQFVEGNLSEGWLLRETDQPALRLITDSEIFGWERPLARPRIQRVVESPEDVYADLKPDDWVVHMDYGIGRFIGLVNRKLEGMEREFLCIEYEGGNQIFVPIHQADRITRYIGPDEEPPMATRLGTPEWFNSKQKVKEAVQEVARDLLELYSKRQIAKGFAFSPDSPWQKELEASFPFIETEDQKQAILETKQDMETPRPMDRLLCGDVGYGKTEVALRAAFKAVMDGKQVAMLVPTTVLAQQHFETFHERLAPFPVVVEMLSRFLTSREQSEVLIKLANSEADIVIGTHRLIQVDVEFKNLGLVIIDEEQRFGVVHKEYFKKLRTEVDVLTLTATPIPRTLYMALTGVRDISVINTPPAERQPVVTHIGPYSPKLVRQAILRELERGGQIFFLHNRVQTIHAMEHHLQLLVPEAKIGIAHGQLPEKELSEIMLQFTHGKIDILLCTSIIESGLDIPNANTLIVDRGDTFGLAQLYQLRGRVGRSAQRAYAYFFRHRVKAPTFEGQERLEIIAENTQLGSGYSIAMRDLEMRGAGDLLGIRQHGFIAAVGFHLYSRMLAQSVRQLRKQTGVTGISEPEKAFRELREMVNVDLPISIGIPLDTIPEQIQRLRLYRRMADLQSEAEVDSLRDEFRDRFGSLSEEVMNLFYYLQVRARVQAAGLSSVSAEGNQIVLRFPPLLDEAEKRDLPNLKQARAGKNSYWMPFSPENDSWQKRLLELLMEISELRLS